jgi:hypothetical protein
MSNAKRILRNTMLCLALAGGVTPLVGFTFLCTPSEFAAKLTDCYTANKGNLRATITCAFAVARTCSGR